MHMLERKCQAVSQITFDEDMNVPDVKPDMGRMIQKKGNIQIEDIQKQKGKPILPEPFRYFFSMSATVKKGISKVLWEIFRWGKT